MKRKQSSKVRGGPLPEYEGTEPSKKTSAKAVSRIQFVAAIRDGADIGHTGEEITA